ncbi:MAG: WXG100 family type VII secretion target [Cryobacterium sp.]|nr:WXG100 family type VII secretion target [Cryobacterium sp.]
MQSMSVNPAQVTALANELRTGSNNIRQTLETLESEVGKLRASWGGDAQEQYDAAQRKWSQTLGEMQALLTQIAAKTEEISTQYVHADNTSAQRFAI